MSTQDSIAVNPMSRRCPQFRGRFSSIDGSDDIDIYYVAAKEHV